MCSKFSNKHATNKLQKIKDEIDFKLIMLTVQNPMVSDSHGIRIWQLEILMVRKKQ